MDRWTLAIAIYGAGLSTFNTIRTHIRERHRLIVKLKHGLTYGPTGEVMDLWIIEA